jgi:hypothetical protein
MRRGWSKLWDNVSRVEVEIDEVTASFIDLENLKKSKQASGRLQDLADLENLE